MSVGWLREMLRIRRFEERAAEAYTQGRIRGFLHLYIGEEAVAVGTLAALGPDDDIVSTYREHGHALARGLPAAALMAELYGKATGCSRGRGGSMHFFDVSRRFYGGNAIVAGGLPLAAGLALADVLRGGGGRVHACFFGDGAVDEGEFHETLNLAALWRLPVLFVCENNLYAMGTALARHQAEPALLPKPAAYGMRAASVDGMDVEAVAAAARDAAAFVRAGDGPFFLEARTYRFRAHSMYDAELYRSREEVEGWKQRDPIVLETRRLRAAGALDDATLAAIEREVAAEIDAAVAAAETAPWEPLEDLARDVHTPRSAPCA